MKKLGTNLEKITKIKHFINKYNWEEINVPSQEDDRKKFEKNNVTIHDFGVSTTILNPVDIFCRWYKLNIGFLRGHVKLRHITEILLKG